MNSKSTILYKYIDPDGNNMLISEMINNNQKFIQGNHIYQLFKKYKLLGNNTVINYENKILQELDQIKLTQIVSIINLELVSQNDEIINIFDENI